MHTEMHLLSYPLADDLEEKASYSWLILAAFGWAGLKGGCPVCRPRDAFSRAEHADAVHMQNNLPPAAPAEAPALAGSCPCSPLLRGCLYAGSYFIAMGLRCIPLLSHPLPRGLAVPWSSQRALGLRGRVGSPGAGPAGIGAQQGWRVGTPTQHCLSHPRTRVSCRSWLPWMPTPRRSAPSSSTSLSK